MATNDRKSSSSPGDKQVAQNDKDKYDAIPDPKTLATATDINVYDKDGKELPFKSLYEKPGRHLIVFIRHFFCGSCEDYVRALNQTFSSDKLSSDFNLASISLIGCGGFSQIPGYHQRTSCAFPIYANPQRELYKTFGMVENWGRGERPEYIKSGLASAVVNSISNAAKAGVKGAMDGGKSSQNGGEILFETDSEGKSVVKWMHRMRNTTDHTEMKDLIAVLQ